MVSQGPALARSAQELLGEFVRTGDQAPFEEIVRRYAGMVFNVCYQILRDTHDAEDATQAVFLTLAVKSKTEDGIKYLAPWLQKVAQRLALDVRRSKTRRKVREERHSVMREMNAGDGDTSRDVDLDEVKIVLRDELDKLPAKYRLPLILHYFGGLKPEEMARELGCKPSTLGVRLHRGRKLLAENLASRGVSVSGTMLGVALAAMIQGSVHEHLIHQTSYAAAQAFAGNTVGSGISAQVAVFNRVAENGLLISKIKSAVAAAALLASAAAGAAEFVARVKPFGIEMNLPGQIKSTFESIFRAFSKPLRTPIASAPQPSPAALAPAPIAPKDDAAIQVFTLTAPIGSPTILAAANPQIKGDAALFSAPNSAGSSTSTGTHSIAHPTAPLSLPQPTIAWATPTRFPATPIASTPSPAPAPEKSSAQTPEDVAPPIIASGDMTVGGGFGSNEHFTYNTPAPMSVGNLTVGGKGFGDFHQSSGAIRADHVALGEEKGSRGSYLLDGDGKLQAGSMTIGGAGDGSFTIASGSASLDAGQIVIGRDAGSTGHLTVHDGKVNAGGVAVGVKGSGVITQDGGHTTIGTLKPDYFSTANLPPGSDGLNVATAPGGEGIWYMKKGELTANKIVVAAKSLATVNVSGGTVATNFIGIAPATDSNGTVKLTGGSFKIARADQWRTGVVVSNSGGTGALAIGDETGTGSISEFGRGKPVSAVVRNSAEGSGRLIGWGGVHLRGVFTQNGKVVADGYGHDRDLDLSSFARIENTIENAPGSDNGWFARHGAGLMLPPMDITSPASTVTWGESADDDKLDLINSARFTFTGVQNAGEHSVKLLAADRSDVPPAPAGVQFASIWHGDFDSLGADAMSVILRYDDTFSPGIAGGNVQLWTFDGGQWLAAGPSATVDLTDRLITATLSPTDWFAVSTINSTALYPDMLSPSGTSTPTPILGVNVPEPAATSVIALGSCFAFSRRRRTRV